MTATHRILVPVLVLLASASFAGAQTGTCGPCPFPGACPPTFPLGAGPGEDHSCEDHSGASLAVVDLSGANLSYADFSGANILVNSDLSGADLSHADLAFATFPGVILDGADLSSANLTGANLMFASLEGAVIRDSTTFAIQLLMDLTGADLTNSTILGVDRGGFFATNLEAPNTSWGGCDFGSSPVTGSNFSGATMNFCDFEDASPSGCTFDGASLRFAQFSGTNLGGSSFVGADLTNAVFFTANPNGADFTDAICQADFPALNFGFPDSSAIFTRADLTGANLLGAGLTSSSFVDATMTSCFAEFAEFQDCDFAGADLTGAVMGTAIIQNCSFDGATVGGVDFGDTDLSGSTFAGCDFTGVDLSGATLTGADFSSATNLAGLWSGTPPTFDCDTLLPEPFDPLADGWSFTGTPCSTCGPCPWVGYCVQTLPFGLGSGEDHRCEDLAGLVNVGADLRLGLLPKADLTGTDLRDANLEEADFTGADLTLANLEGAFIAGADFTDATLIDADMEAVDAEPQGGEEIDAGGLFKNAMMGGARLVVANLANSKMIGADLQGANLTLANMTNVDATGANFTGATFFQATMTNITAQGANFTSTTLEQADLTGGNFRQADMTEAVFSNAIVSGANFSSADLSNAVGLQTTTFTENPIYDCATDFSGTGFDPVAEGWDELAGPIVDLGGGCGGGGTMTVSGLSLMGQPLTFDLTGADPVATDARLAFNFKNEFAPFGACVWMVWQPSPAFRIPTTPVNGVDQVVLPLPCSNSLSGITINAQWNVFPTTASPWVLPNFSLSNIVQFTMGG